MNKNIRHTLIGIAGKQGSGKDTVANYIEDQIHSKVSVRIYHFADPLKQCAVEAFGIPKEHFYDETLKEVIVKQWNMTPRKMLQILGTECFRDHFSANFWIVRADIELQREIYKNTITVISDVRFENEARFIRERGGLIVHVFREDEDITLKQALDKHRSEQTLLIHNADWVIRSPTGIDILQSKTDFLIKYLFETGVK